MKFAKTDVIALSAQTTLMKIPQNFPDNHGHLSL